ncbi:imelysin family protein [Marinimicrobium sp. ARAG 43.8]|uniref:imelysin family protein n=1 Tax=Marinimicrobium sp. ARAG 43.8 TaxID=3418719 RepID=UPI003CF12EFE
MPPLVHRCWPVLLSLILVGCDRGGESSAPPPPELASPEPKTTLGPPDPALEQATTAAWALGETWLRDTNTLCDAFHSVLQTLLEAPDEQRLTDARSHWHQCHNRWHRLTPLLTLGESNPGLFADLNQIRFLIDAHPLQPGYLDGLEQYPYSGIVNDITLPINAATLREQHGLTDDADVVLGLHALEFLLWGETGTRTADDFIYQREVQDEQREAELSEAQLPRNRRRELTRLISQLLQDDLNALEQRWQATNLRPTATYHHLHPASRLPLLREALIMLLGNRLPDALAQQETSEQAHNRFAGRNEQPVLAALSGTDQLLSTGNPTLLSQLLSPADQDAWQQAWQPINNALTAANDTAGTEWPSSLPVLADLLTPSDPLSTPTLDTTEHLEPIEQQ